MGWSLLRAGDFFCKLNVLYGGLGIGKLQFLIKKKKKNSAAIFFNFWPLKPWIRIGIQPKMLDPDPDEMNADPQPWLKHHNIKTVGQFVFLSIENPRSLQTGLIASK